MQKVIFSTCQRSVSHQNLSDFSWRISLQRGVQGWVWVCSSSFNNVNSAALKQILELQWATLNQHKCSSSKPTYSCFYPARERGAAVTVGQTDENGLVCERPQPFIMQGWSLTDAWMHHGRGQLSWWISNAPCAPVWPPSARSGAGFGLLYTNNAQTHPGDLISSIYATNPVQTAKVNGP